MKAVKVVIVAEHASAAFGGEAILPLHYFRYLIARGIDVRMVVHERTKSELESCLGESIDKVYFIKDNVVMQFLSNISERLPPGIAVLTSSALIKMTTQVIQRSVVRRLVKDYSISVVHQPIPVSPKFPSLMFGLGAPVIIGPMNGGMTFPKGYDYMQGRAEKVLTICSRVAAHVVNILIPGKFFAKKLLVANERTKQALPAFFSGESQLLVENGVDLSLFSRPRNKQDDSIGRDNDGFLKLVFLGRLVKLKGVDMLIEAFSQIEDNKKLELHVVGDGGERADLELMVKRLGLEDSVTFHGSVPQEVCPELIGSMDILVLPSVRECGGAVVLEAMSMGVPVIASSWGGPADYIDESCGILVDPVGGKEVFTVRLKKAIESLVDDTDLRLRLGRSGREKVEREYDWNIKIDKIVNIYQEVADC